MFTLHPRLSADTLAIKKLDICGVHLMNDARYPWVVLVPEITDLTELHHMMDADYKMVMQEMRQVSQAMENLYAPKKMNVGALGNLVPQLHIHILARFETDESWPGPVWGVGSPQVYSEDVAQEKIQRIKAAL